MGYNDIYQKILQDRTPFQVAKSEEIRKRNEEFFKQEQALKLAIRERNYPTANHTTQRQVFKAAEAFINRVCKEN
jgi:hypothetical protein